MALDMADELRDIFTSGESKNKTKDNAEDKNENKSPKKDKSAKKKSGLSFKK